MSAKSPVVVATFCTVLLWVPPVVLLSGDRPLPIMILFTMLAVPVWIAVFFGSLTVRDTIRQRGMFGVNKGPVVCPQCGTLSRRGMMFPDWKEICYGGWTCHECGIELSQYGRPWKQQNTLAKWAVLQAAEEGEENRHRSESADERIREANDQTQRGDVS